MSRDEGGPAVPYRRRHTRLGGQAGRPTHRKPARRPRVDGEGVALLLGFIAFAAVCVLFVIVGAGWTTD